MKNLTILYGSQTGCAEDMAKRISWLASRRQFQVTLSDMNSYPFPQLIEEQVVLFVCSTMGQGEEPENMVSFWRLLLRKDLPSNSLNGVHYGVIGLGDSEYTKFNFVAKRLHKRLKQLGGNPLLEPALGDDQHELGPDAVIDPWLIKFWAVLGSLYPEMSSLEPLPEDTILPSTYDVQFLNETENSKPFQPNRSYQLSKVIENKRQTSESHFQDVRLLKFKTSLIYNTGDVAIVLPENSTDMVDKFFDLLTKPRDLQFVMKSNDPRVALPEGFPNPCTIEECAKKYWDLQSVPKRSFFELFWRFSPNSLEAEKLKEFCTAEGQDDLYTYCNRPKRSILEVFQDFSETTRHIPFQYLFDLIPPIRTRRFTIASSATYCPGEIHLLVAVVKYSTRLKTPRFGLCSNYLAKLKEEDEIYLGIGKGTFKWPRGETVPAILVGPGTGCAPFRAFAQERYCHGIKDITYLYFGCRNEKGDFLCQQDWEKLQKENVLRLITAFSRDQQNKVYVQHKIKEDRKMLWSLISELKASIFIAGNAKQMPQNVRDAFVDVIQEYGGLQTGEAKMYLQDLEAKGRLQYEVWA